MSIYVIQGLMLLLGLPCVGETGTAPRSPASGVKDEFLAMAKRLRLSNNEYLGELQARSLMLRSRDQELSSQERSLSVMQLSSHLLQSGDVDGGIEAIETACSMVSRFPQFRETLPAKLYRLRALAYLRKAEVSNCVRRHNADCCIFPLRGGGVHAIDGPARKAKENYLAVLDQRPDDLAMRWLLNVVSMALGEYPKGVSDRYRIPLPATETDFLTKPFVDVAPKLGLHTFNLCGGIIVEDFDNDGLLDIITSTYDPEGPLTFYHNRGEQGFKNESALSGCDQQLGGLNCIATDFNDDGFTDVMILRGAWLFDDGRMRNSLLRNNGNRTFTDVTHQAGLADPASPTQAAVWADFDNDGDLDLYVANESRVEWGSDGNYPSQLFRNNGDGSFTNIAETAGVTNDRYAKGVAAGDYDNDGDTDLYVSNIGLNRLYRNNGDGTYTDVAVALHVEEPWDRSFACWFFDYDNDGWLDLFVAAYNMTLADLAADYLEQPHKGVSPRLYRNNHGRFEDVTVAAGLDHPYLPMGANFGDIDNDGYLDIYLATGEPGLEALMPNVMLRNDGGRRFDNITTMARLGHLQKGHGVAFADLDNDGDQDIYHQLGGFYRGDRFHNALFMNPGHGNHYVFIELIGTVSNRRAVGARIKVVVERADGVAEIHRAVGAVSSFGGSPARQEIGLGRATAIKRIEVTWPVSGTEQVFENVPLDKMIRVTEGVPEFKLVQLRPVRW